jgi:hypothetical protein
MHTHTPADFTSFDKPFLHTTAEYQQRNLMFMGEDPTARCNSALFGDREQDVTCGQYKFWLSWS